VIFIIELLELNTVRARKHALKIINRYPLNNNINNMNNLDSGGSPAKIPLSQ
jgi:hypothetical protein